MLLAKEASRNLKSMLAEFFGISEIAHNGVYFWDVVVTYEQDLHRLLQETVSCLLESCVLKSFLNERLHQSHSSLCGPFGFLVISLIECNYAHVIVVNSEIHHIFRVVGLSLCALLRHTHGSLKVLPCLFILTEPIAKLLKKTSTFHSKHWDSCIVCPGLRPQLPLPQQRH